jgi:hypothetical protein
MGEIEFNSDKVLVRTGRVDNSAIVQFEVGEYEVHKLKELIGVVDKVLKVKINIDG